MTEDIPHFVWVFGMKGPVGQKWDALNNGYKREYLFAHPITHLEFRDLTIEQLEKKYPMPEISK